MKINSKLKTQNSKLAAVLLAAFLLPACLLAVNFYPQPQDKYVNDYAGILAATDRNTMGEMLKNLERQTGIEMTVVTIKSLSDYPTGDSDIESFATGLFNSWGVGKKKQNNGILMLVSKDDRKMRIELGAGYGFIYDAAMQQIIEKKMIPFFKDGYYSRGIYEGAREVVNKVTRRVSFFEFYWKELLVGLLIIVFVLAGINFIIKGKTGWGFAFLTAAFILFVLLLKMLASGKSTKSFGGGNSFGGGASGSW